MVNTVFGAGSPNANSALGKLNNLQKQVQNGNVAGAQSQAQNIVAFIQQKAAQGGLPGTTAQIQMLLSNVLCFAGLSPDTFLIYPTDAPQVLLNSSGKAGVSLQGNTVTTPTLLTVTLLDPNGPSPLDTKLDKYPGYVQLDASSPLTKPAVVGVCPASTTPADVRDRLRLGHQGSSGFEITPSADASFLDCSGVAQSKVPGWLRSLASLVLPRPLYAAEFAFAGGVGGVANEFSPFGPVDPQLSFAGGVGGVANEFSKRPMVPISVNSSKAANAPTTLAPESKSSIRKPGALAPTVVGGVCTTVDALVGSPLAPECRPVVTITTHNGTVLQNVPVNWSVALGGGVIAPLPGSCDPLLVSFGSTASNATDLNGKASVCWTLGAAGTNTVLATPIIGGDAPSGVTFLPATGTFTATALTITPTVNATGGTFTYDNLSHAGSGTCSNALAPALSYSGGGAVPQDVGTYTLTVTCGAGDPLYTPASATATITIQPYTPVVTVTCPASQQFTGSALTPCSATVTGPGLNGTPTPTYSSNVNVGTATASVSVAATGNYAASSASATFSITTAPSSTVVTCPASVVYTGSTLAPCTAVVTGVGGVTLATITPTYSPNVNVGTVTASASAAASGNYGASSGSATFAITAAPSSTVVTCPVSVPYTGSALTPCTAVVTGVGGVTLSTITPTYSPNVNVGTVTASASAAASGNYGASSGSATFAITPASTIASLTCPTSVNYTGSALTPCTGGGVTGPGLSLAITPTYSSNVVGTATATVSYAGGGNYQASSISKTFQIRYVQSGCFSSPLFSVMPPTKSSQNKGSNLPVKCTLTTGSGAGVTNATGDLKVEDRGTDGTASPVTVFSKSNAFSVSNGGNYAYGLATSPAGFVSTHYYFVTATWSDGSTTTGWFYIK